ncbi:MAG: hypothetical protein EOP88_20430, partial [Verrucomicrobiaceae bacterium]
MQWIFDHFQVVVIALVVVGSLVKNALESWGRKSAEYNAPEEEDERPRVPIDQDKSYRKMPRPSAPPPLERHSGGPP